MFYAIFFILVLFLFLIMLSKVFQVLNTHVVNTKLLKKIKF